LQDYQKWQIQAFLASLPPSEMPKSLPDLKKILVEKKVEIQVRSLWDSYVCMFHYQV
jgi:hypothetical protein